MAQAPWYLAAMRETIRPLARTLATRMARRRRRRDRGRLDVRRTVRRSLSSGGVPIDPVFRRPKVARPDLYVLCDVSGSVAEFASFTLTLLQAMASEFPRMRTFAFVDGVDEVTAHLKDVASFLEVRHVLYRADVVRADGHSDYGAVLDQFWEHHSSSIDPRSTVIITGDARSNHRPPSRRRRSRRSTPGPGGSICSTRSRSRSGTRPTRSSSSTGPTSTTSSRCATSTSWPRPSCGSASLRGSTSRTLTQGLRCTSCSQSDPAFASRTSPTRPRLATREPAGLAW